MVYISVEALKRKIEEADKPSKELDFIISWLAKKGVITLA